MSIVDSVSKGTVKNLIMGTKISKMAIDKIDSKIYNTRK